MFLRDLLQPMHLIVLLAIYLMFFGTRKLPEFGKSLGEGLKGFKEAIHNVHESASAPVATSPAPMETVTAEPTIAKSATQ